MPTGIDVERLQQLLREGAQLVEVIAYAGDLVDAEPPTCAPGDTVEDVRDRLKDSASGFCLVLTEARIVLGRVRRGVLAETAPATPVDRVMEPGPSTVRPSTPAADLARRLATAGPATAIVTTPAGRLIGVFDRADAERAMHSDAHA